MAGKGKGKAKAAAKKPTEKQLLHKQLDDAGVAYPKSANIAKLKELLAEHQKGEGEGAQGGGEEVLVTQELLNLNPDWVGEGVAAGDVIMVEGDYNKPEGEGDPNAANDLAAAKEKAGDSIKTVGAPAPAAPEGATEGNPHGLKKGDYAVVRPNGELVRAPYRKGEHDTDGVSCKEKAESLAGKDESYSVVAGK